MKKCELLSPAGNMEMLKYAVMYGADAVYLAGTRFGARKFANNFTEEELIEAIKFAHLYGVKAYITINTLIYENEVEDFLNYAKFIYKIGVDAVLVQDFGMLSLLHKTIPDLELHASTQMHNNGSNMINILKKYGVKRVVLDREMTLDEISKLPENIEIEVFCHGALCVSYSGQCLFSKFVLNRSGNRGECAGLCRLPYALESNGNTLDKKYYLSLKDICTIDNIDQILAQNIDSLKIEGRMKSPEYVGYITKIYRELIDAYYENKERKITLEERKNIALLFNRGFTNGFIMDTPNEEMVNRENPNHQGIHLGTYESSKDKIKISLDEDLEQGDIIRFKTEEKGMTVNFLYNKNGKLINHASKNDTVYVDNFLTLTRRGEVRKVSSILLNKQIHNLPARKVFIIGQINVKKEMPIELIIKDGKNSITVFGAKPSIAQNRPITQNDILKQITKTGTTVYEFKNLEVNLDENLFINLKDLNVLRREALEKLNAKRTEERADVKFDNYQYNEKKIPKEKSLKVVVNTKEQLISAQKYTNFIFTSNPNLLKENIYLKLPENTSKIESTTYMVSDLGSLNLINKGDQISSDYMLNVTNSYTANTLINMGVSSIALSPEIDLFQVKEIVKNTNVNAIEILLYGHIELMKMKFNPYPNVSDYSLIDRNKSKYSIKSQNGINYLMSSNPIDKIDIHSELLKMGIRKFRVDFYKESKTEVEKILSKITEILDKNE